MRRRFRKTDQHSSSHWHERRLDGPLREPGSAYRHNGYTQYKSSNLKPSVSIPSCLSVFAWIYRHHGVLWARCVEEGRCTAKQLEAIELVFVEGLSANEAGRKLGVSTQAVCDRMNGIANRCPPIYRWWRRVTDSHRGRGNRSPRSERRSRRRNNRKAKP